MKWSIPFLLVTLFLIGCGSSSPRFASGQKTEDKQYQKRKSAIRFSSKVKEDEMKEDDRKVNIKEVKARFSSAKESSPVGKKNITKEEVKKTEPASTSSSSSAGFEKQKMMDAILAWMGTPYEYGAESKSGTDCSGFTMQIFKESAGMDLPRTTEEQVKLGSAVTKDDLKFGDLIFFNTTGENPSHVGIYIGDDMFAHASVSFGVTLSSMYSSYYKKRYTEARRVIQ